MYSCYTCEKYIENYKLLNRKTMKKTNQPKFCGALGYEAPCIVSVEINSCGVLCSSSENVQTEQFEEGGDYLLF